MRNQGSIFLIFCLCLTVGLVSAYTLFVQHFNGSQQYKVQLTHMERDIEKEKFNNALLAYQLKDFQQTVAQLLPDNKTLQARMDLQNLASTVRAPASEDKIDLSSVLFERGKKFFQEKDYNKAIREFSKITETYPLSAFGVESRFLTAESYFLKKDYKSSLQYIDEMVTLYPDHELTGFILLRMGQMSEINNQYDEASEIYRTVIKNFKNEGLRAQAKKLAKSLEYE